jgi:hypothetical protein
MNKSLAIPHIRDHLFKYLKSVEDTTANARKISSQARDSPSSFKEGVGEKCEIP